MRGSCDAGAKSILQAFGLLKKSETLKYSKENELIVKDELIQEQDNINNEIKNNSVEDEWNNISGIQFQINQLESDIVKENSCGTKSSIIKKNQIICEDIDKTKSTETKKYSSKFKSTNKNNFENSLIISEITVKNEITTDTKEKSGPFEDLEVDFATEYDSEYEYDRLDDSLSIFDEGKIGRKNKMTRKNSKYLDDDDWEELRKCKPSQKIKTAKSNQEKNVELSDDNKTKKTRAKEYRLSEVDLELYKKFELPKPIEDYRKQPKDIKSCPAKSKMEAGNSKNIMSKSPSLRPINCSYCQVLLSGSFLLKDHVIKFHSEHLRCPICDAANSIEDVDKFKRHLFIHLGTNHLLL